MPSNPMASSGHLVPHASRSNGGAVYSAPTWVACWFIISTVLVAWDTGFVLMRLVELRAPVRARRANQRQLHVGGDRPRSFRGGDLHWLWSPGAFARKEGFTSAQAIMNIVESILNLAYLALAGQKSPVAVLVGFTAVVMTAAKTVLYWLVDQQSGWASTFVTRSSSLLCRTAADLASYDSGHNTPRDWFWLFAVPNGAWIVFPTLLAFMFGSEIARSLRLAAKQKVL
ncbi:SPOSA6832_00690 [Sporobolomyces salmonicolor]|uniref:SPOSA6832_00690-mRNA-1:cds n=1 Tax=Sporidiobolus salmonicolor TaxID=5005 RepID=A0A0D6EGX3_SPOSA|nr:SPOSA6832_00690 [Sporobolomyces salmonicolor]